jgi:hypothetical protein
LVIEERVLPRSPYRLRRAPGSDGVMRSRGGILERLLHVGRSPVRARAWQDPEGYVHIRAESIDPGLVAHTVVLEEDPPPAAADELAVAVERVRFSLAVEDDLSEFYATPRSSGGSCAGGRRASCRTNRIRAGAASGHGRCATFPRRP